MAEGTAAVASDFADLSPNIQSGRHGRRDAQLPSKIGRLPSTFGAVDEMEWCRDVSIAALLTPVGSDIYYYFERLRDVTQALHFEQ